jgi:hypothetical protein
MRINWIVCAMAVMTLFVTGCSKAPQADIDAAKAALEQAAVAEANVYASEHYAAAEDAMKQLEAELTVQEEKSSLFRRYGKAKELAAEVKTAGEAAAAAAVSGKEKVQGEAMQTLTATRELLAEVQEMLAKAPTGKGTRADLAAMKADVEGVQTALDEADAAFAAGGYMEAQTGAEAAREVLEQVKADITAAIEARSAARAKR